MTSPEGLDAAVSALAKPSGPSDGDFHAYCTWIATMARTGDAHLGTANVGVARGPSH